MMCGLMPGLSRRGRLVFLGARLVGTFLVILGPIAISSASQQPTAKHLQRSAVTRIGSYLQHLRKAGEKAAPSDELKQAAQELDQAYRAFLAAGNIGEAALCRVEAARTRYLQRQYDEALRFGLEAEALARKANTPTTVARALIGQGKVRLYGKKDIEGAGATSREAVRVSSTLPDQTSLLEAYCLQGQTEVAKGELYAALRSINLAAALIPQVKDESLHFWIYNDRTDVLFELAKKDATLRILDSAFKNAEMAVADAEKALALAKKLGWDKYAEGADLLVRSRNKQRMIIAAEMERPKIDFVFNPAKPSDVHVNQEFVSPRGIPLRHELVAMIKTWVEDDSADATRAYVKAQVESLSGQSDKALAGYLRAVDLLEADYRPLKDIEARATLLDSRVDFYYWPMRHLLQRNKDPEAFRLMEAWRARTLTDLLMTRQKVEFAGGPQKELYAELRAVRADSAGQRALYERLLVAEEKDKAHKRLQQIKDLEKKHQTLLQDIRSTAPELLKLVTTDTVPLAEVQEAAAKGGYDVLEYLVLDSQVILWHIGKSGVHVRSIFLPRGQLDSKLKALQAALRNTKGAFDATASKQLFLYLVQPMLPFVTTDHLVVIPHEELHRIPFQALQDPTGQYLADRFRVSYAPSASLLQRMPRAGNLAGSAMLALAGPKLADAKREVAAIGRLYPKGTKVVLDKKATKTLFKLNAEGYDVLHLAAHADFVGDEPMLSCVYLWEGETDDGKLTAAEMFALSLKKKTRLVTLSACDTGQVGSAHTGEMIGMPRALIYAGAEAVLLTHWQVDSAATSLWMQTFYREAEHTSLPDAVRRANIDLMTRPDYAHPRYWGAFYLVGR